MWIRLKIELDLITDKGYIDYFLITNDFTQWAHENDILMSPGRGSASGSLICWLVRYYTFRIQSSTICFLKDL